ncbi:MAG: FIST C-terminal domain-containing protein [Nitrospirota bacterium]|nr:FIST C-terminal domain-containing protein [Nitrospirota bacterium]
MTRSTTDIDRMQWDSALSTRTSLEEAVAQCASTLSATEPYDLLFVFVSPEYPGVERLPELLAEAIPHRHMVGCGGGGLIGQGREIEFNQALSVVAARLPGVAVTPFRLTAETLSGIGSSPAEWAAALGVPREDHPDFVVLADPFSFPAEDLLAGLDFAYTGAQVIGGMASGAEGPGNNVLFIDGRTERTGAVGVALSGDIHIETVVAQGVRPVGEVLMVTKSEAHVLHELDEEPALAVLGRMFAELPEEDRELARSSLFLGIAQSAVNDHPEHGDYLIRNVLGITKDESSLVVGEKLREGQLVRFHVRDGASSAADLIQMLSAYLERHQDGPKASGALLFSCLGRGQSLYGTPNHDAEAFATLVDGVPMGGFFCNGEIGPVGDATYLHGYTSAFAIFHPAQGLRAQQ